MPWSRYTNVSTGKRSVENALGRTGPAARASMEARGESGSLMERAARIWDIGKEIQSWRRRARGQREQGLSMGKLAREIETVKLKTEFESRRCLTLFYSIEWLTHMYSKQILSGGSRLSFSGLPSPGSSNKDKATTLAITHALLCHCSAIGYCSLALQPSHRAARYYTTVPTVDTVKSKVILRYDFQSWTSALHVLPGRKDCKTKMKWVDETLLRQLSTQFISTIRKTP